MILVRVNFPLVLPNPQVVAAMALSVQAWPVQAV